MKSTKKWGLVDWFEDVVLVDPTFDNPEDIPLVWIECWAKDMFITSKKKLKSDVLIINKSFD